MNFVERLSPHRDSRDGHPIRMVLVHGDAGSSDEGTLSWLEDPQSKVSYHYFIGRDGTIYLVVPAAERAWHAGKSEWLGMTVGNSVNHTSIGVGFANRGPHVVDGLHDVESYAAIQYQVGGELIARIMSRYGIPIDKVRGHADVSPGRKSDPWGHFDWRKLYGWIGWYLSGRAS